MAIIKASYTRHVGKAKAAVRYIEHRPGKDRQRLVRTLFNADGKVARAEVYAMIDQTVKGSYFFRIIISPDPRGEDQDNYLNLRELTVKMIQSLEDRFQQPLPWVAAVHADHAKHRHVHIVAIVPERLHVPDLQQMHRAATEEALEQRRQLDLARDARELSQEQSSERELLW